MRRQFVVGLALFVGGCGESAPLAHSPQLVATPTASAAPATSADATSGVAHALGAPVLPYPASRRVDAKDRLFGTDVPDPYRWLEDAKAPEVQAWLKSQDDFARSRLKELPERAGFAAREKAFAYFDSVGTPVRRGARLFYEKRAANKEKKALYVREGDKERVLIDPEALAADGSTALGLWEPSPDGSKLVYRLLPNNSDEATGYVLDVATGKPTAIDVLPGVRYGTFAWTPKGDGFFYVFVPPPGPSVPVADRPGFQEVRFHALGTDPKKDPLVFEKPGDPRCFLGIDLASNGRWLVVTVRRGWATANVYIADREQKGFKFRPLVESTTHSYDALPRPDRILIATSDGAERGHVYSVSPTKLDRASWKEIVPERPDAFLKSAVLAGGKLVLTYLKDVAAEIEIHDVDGKLLHVVTLPGKGSVGSYAHDDFVVGSDASSEAYFSFESFVEPVAIEKLDLQTGKATPFHKVSVPFDTAALELTQSFATSKDGTRVPFFVVRRKDTPKDGEARTILQGYGGFRVPQTSRFTPSLLPWLEKGGVFVLANLRGGDELGEAWHRAGMLDKKQNVFDDFYAVAEELVHQRITRPARLAIRGRSNGGLLVGTAMTQRPELFGAVSCGVPLLDMVRYPQFGSGKTWMDEYGSLETEASFRTLFAYSPYHHVVSGTKYPALLMLAADSDDRVDPMHARKFVAAVQNASSGGPALLRVEKNSGHAGADLVRAEVEQRADELAFLWDALGR